MAITIAQLTAQINVDTTAFTKGLENAETKFKSFGQDLKAAGTGLSEFVTGPIVALATGVVKAGMDIDDAFDQIRNKTGATGTSLIGLQSDFRAVFGQVTQGAQETGAALGQLSARTGLTGQALQDLGLKTLTLARLTKTDALDAIDSTTRAFEKFGVPADQYSKKLDLLYAMQQRTGTSFRDTATQLTQFGATMQQLGMGFDKSAAIFSKWDQEGVKTQLVANALRTGLKNMFKEGIEDPTKAFPMLIDQIKNAGSESDAAAKSIAVFGVRGGTDLAEAIRKGQLSVDDFTNAAKKNENQIMKTAKAVDDWPQNLAKLRNQVILTIEPIGTQFFKALNDVVSEMKGPLISALQEAVRWWTSLKPSTQIAIVAFAAAAASVGPVLFVVGQLVISIGALLPVFAAVTAFLIGPWGIAFVGAGIAVYQMVVKGATSISQLMANIKDFAAYMMPAWKNLWSFVSGTFGAVWNVAVALIKFAFGEIIAAVNVLRDFFNGGGWDKLWDDVKEAWHAFWDNLKDIAVKGVWQLVTSIWDGIKGAFQTIFGGTKEQMDSLQNQVAQDSKDGLVNGANAAAKDPGVKKAGIDLGKMHIQNIVNGIKQQFQQSTAEINQHLQNLFAAGHKKTKKPKLTEAQKELNELTQLTQQAQAQLNQLDASSDMSTSKLFGRFHAIAQSQHDKIIQLADLRANIAMAQEAQTEMHKWSSMMDEAKEKVIQLKNEGKPTAEALAAIFPSMSGTKNGQMMLASLAKELDLKKDLTKASEDHRKAVDKENHLSEEANTKLGDLQGEYLRLTHTRYEDIAALDLYGKTFDQISDKEHAARAEQIAFWMHAVDAEKELIESKKEEQRMTDEIGKSIADMNQKLLLKSPATEAANSARNALTAFKDLPQITQQLEEQDEAMRRWNTDFTKLSPVLQAQIVQYLNLAHAVNIKTKANEDDDKKAEKSKTLTTQLTDKLAELNQKIFQLTHSSAPKQANFVTDILAQQLKLTDDQKKMLDEIIQKQKQLDTLDKQAKALNMVATTLKSTFTTMFDGLMSGSKNVFGQIEQSFVKMLEKMASDYLANQIVSMLLGSPNSSGNRSGGLLSGILGAFGARASGGMVQPGGTYVVGENGPELFRAPSSGQIVPNGQAGAGAASTTVNVQMTVVAQDANSFRYSSQQIAQNLGNTIQRSMQRNG